MIMQRIFVRLYAYRISILVINKLGDKVKYVTLIIFIVVLSGCGSELSNGSESNAGPEVIADHFIDDKAYQKLSSEVWFTGIGIINDVVSFYPQGLVTVSPMNSEGFISSVYGVKGVEPQTDGSINLAVFDFDRNENTGLGNFTIKVSPIVDGECEIQFKHHSGRFITARKQISAP